MHTQLGRMAWHVNSAFRRPRTGGRYRVEQAMRAYHYKSFKLNFLHCTAGLETCEYG